MPSKIENNIRRRIKIDPDSPSHLARSNSRQEKQKSSKTTKNDIWRRVKIELESPSHSASTSRQEKQTVSKTVLPKTTEKQLLIEKIADLQRENQRVVHSSLEYKKQQLKIEQENSEKIRALTKEINELRTQLKTVELTFANTKCDKEKTISDLRNENRLLQARIKQLQSTANGEHKQMLDSSESDSDSDAEGTFEVEKLIDHKRKRDGLYFLVRWKKFTKKDDTWEHENNLWSLEILDEYKKQNNLFFSKRFI